jgi:hypothetical protein
MHQGSCLCGVIKYAIDDNLQFVVNCHCRFCRKAHGASFTTLLLMPFLKFEVLEGKESIASYEIKTIGAVRCFCSICGTQLYNYSPTRGMISLMVATLDANPEIHPLANINTGSKCSWFEIEDDLPRFSAVPTQDEFARLLSP